MSPDCTLVYIPVGPVFDANGAKLSDDPCFIDVRTGKTVMELETIDMQEGLALSPNNDFMFFTRNQGDYNADRGHTEVIRNSRTGREFICGSYENFLVCEFSEDYRYIYGDVYGHGYRILYRLQWDYEPAQS